MPGAPGHDPSRSAIFRVHGEGLGQPSSNDADGDVARPSAVSRIHAVAAESETSPTFTPVAWRESGAAAAGEVRRVSARSRRQRFGKENRVVSCAEAYLQLAT